MGFADLLALLRDERAPAGHQAVAPSGFPDAADRPNRATSRLARHLSTGTWTHDYPITFEEAQQLGLNVSSDMPPVVLQLMSLFPQPVRRQPSVEFLPGPRRAESPKPPAVSR
jgi:hypothetical protein